jgi:predicted aldo/keto reductase-like oxidoreductase
MAKLGFGMMRLPLLDENDFTNIDIEQVKEMVECTWKAVLTILIQRLFIMRA